MVVSSADDVRLILVGVAVVDDGRLRFAAEPLGDDIINVVAGERTGAAVAIPPDDLRDDDGVRRAVTGDCKAELGVEETEERTESGSMIRVPFGVVRPLLLGVSRPFSVLVGVLRAA